MVSNSHSFPVILLLLSTLVSLTSAATAVDLGAAGQYAILGRFGTTVGALVEINGDVAVSPSLSTTLVGFALVPADGYATSSLVNGRLYAPDYGSSCAALDQATTDALAAWNSAMYHTVPAADESKRDLGAGVVSGMTLTPGVYGFGSAITWSTDITLVGGSQDVFLFQANGAISCAASVKVILSGGVQPKNGIVLSNAAVTVGARSTVNGSLFAQPAMTIGARVVVTGPAVAPIVFASAASSSVASSSNGAVASSASGAASTSLPPAATGTLFAQCTASPVAVSETLTAQAVTETSSIQLPASTVTETLLAMQTLPAVTILATVTSTSTIELPAITDTNQIAAAMAVETPTVTVWATATATSTLSLPAVTQTVTAFATMLSTVQLPAVTLTVAESVSVKTVVKPVSTVILATTVTWHQNVVKTVTSTLV